MAGVDFDRTGGRREDDDWFTGGAGYTNPEPPQPGPSAGSDRLGTVQSYYKQFLGRDAEAGAAENWANQGFDLPTIQNYIKNSDEGKAYASRATTPTASSGDWISQTLRDVQSTDDENYWRRVIAADPKVAAGDASAIEYWKDRIRRGDGSALVKSGQLQKFQDGGGGGGVVPNPGGYDDPSSMLYLSEVMKRLQQLQQPQAPDPFEDWLKTFVTDRVNSLQKAPYSEADEQALITRFREPLTQARDASYRRNKEQASQRGFLPSSGLLRHLDSNTDQAYQQGVASGANNLAVQSIDERERRMQEAVQLLSGMVANNRTSQDRTDARARETLSTARILPDFDNQRLDQLLRASSESPTTAISGLDQLARLGLTQQQLANLASADQGSALASMLYQIYHNLGL